MLGVIIGFIGLFFVVSRLPDIVEHCKNIMKVIEIVLEEKTSFKTIDDKYQSYEEIQEALREAGLESSNLIIGIDFTKSNLDTGRKTFSGKSLHTIDLETQNPYQRAISVIGRTLEAFDDDGQIPAYGFGDTTTTDKTIFPFKHGKACNKFSEVLEKYTEIAPLLIFSGPTSFAPIIQEAIEIVQETKSYHILLIVADGQITCEGATKKAIVEASNHPLSIIMVGVGDGPWFMMEEFDDKLPARKFDNFQFVNFSKYITHQPDEHADLNFAIAALQEIPEQYPFSLPHSLPPSPYPFFRFPLTYFRTFKEIRRLGLLKG